MPPPPSANSNVDLLEELNSWIHTTVLQKTSILYYASFSKYCFLKQKVTVHCTDCSGNLCQNVSGNSRSLLYPHAHQKFESDKYQKQTVPNL